MKTYLTVALVLALSGGVWADEIYVPDNNPASTTFNAIPFWAEWSVIQGEIRSQILYNASMLGNRPYYIHEISFASAFTGTFSATQLQVRISHVKTSLLNATMDLNIPGPATCYDGPISYPVTSSTWCPMGLTGGFLYNGVDNLVVEVRYKGGKNTSSSSPGNIGRFWYVANAPIPRNWAYQSYSATQQSGGSALNGLKIRFTVDTTTIQGSGSPAPGSTVDLALLSPSDPGLVYQVGTSLGTGPIPVDKRLLGLSPDTILVVSVSGVLPLVFDNYAGRLDASGQGKAKLNIPNLPVLVGIRLHSAFLTLLASAPSGVKSISNTFSFTITK